MSSAWTEILVSFLVGVVIPAILHKFNVKVPVIVPTPKIPTPDPAVPAPAPGGVVDELLKRLLDRVLANRFGEPLATVSATATPQDAELRKLEMIERLLAPPAAQK